MKNHLRDKFDKKNMVELTIVVPAYNEGTRIYRNIIEIITQVEKFSDSFRVIVVNDGSTDETESEIKRAMATDKRVGLISYDENHGKGYAVKRGIMASKSKYTAFLDADLELPPHLLQNFLDEMGDASIVIGSKMHPDSQVDYPPLRKVMSRVYFYFMKALFRLDTKDTQTGIKLFKTDVAQRIEKYCRCNGYSFDIEMLAIAAKLSRKTDDKIIIKEMPVVVNFSRNKSNKSKIHFKNIFEMIRDSFVIKLHVSRLKVDDE